MRYLFLILILVFNCLLIKSQSIRLYYKHDTQIPKGINLPVKAKDSLAILSLLKEPIVELREASYLSASIDQISIINDSAVINLQIGKPFKWSKLDRGNISDEALSNANFVDKLYFKKPFSTKESISFMSSLVRYYENNGYPFCQIKLKETSISNDEISATLNVDKGPKYYIDSILVKGDVSIGDQYLYNYLGIKPGDLFNNALVNEVGSRLNEIPFLEQHQPFEIQFFKDKAKLILYLDKKSASRFDGIIGLLTNEETGKIEFTGNLELNLINAIGKGESFDLQWRKLIGSTQNLNIHANLPFIFKTPFGLDVKFALYKRDTLFLDIQNKLGIQYLLKGYDYIQLYLQSNSSRRLGNDLTSSISTLPPFADYNSLLYGIRYYKEKLNYRFNPRDGFQLLGDLSVGIKKISTISSLLEINPSAYDNIPLNSTIISGKIDASYFLPIGKRSTIKLRNQTAAIYNDALFENELLRIGGIKTLRGFDEESIFANLFTIGTAEYRFILERNSSIFLFADLAYYEKDIDGSFESDTPLGFGTGINFQTGAGIFSINYAIGQQFNNPIDFRAAKIHFGFVNFF